jgi:serine/threonine protein phosphatase PrpC
MVVKCPSCGAVSRDLEFCDRCNADLAPPAAALPPATCPLIPHHAIRLTAEQTAHLTRPEAAVLVKVRRQALRLHWIGSDLWPRYRAAVETRCQATGPFLPPCRVIEDVTGRWVIAEASGRPATPWLAARLEEPLTELRRLVDFLEHLGRGLQLLRDAGFHWLTFDPCELELAPRGRGLWITNVDLQLLRIDECPPQLPINPHFVAPELLRGDGTRAGSATDVYHLALYGYCWLARLLPGGVLGQGLEAFGHALPALRVYNPRVPPGIPTVLARGYATQPHLRPATPAALCADLRAAMDRAERRAACAAPITWEIGNHTRAGRAKEALGRGNEDAVLARSFTDPPRALLAVADGITTCDVGNGAIASLVTCLALENTVDATCTAADFEPRLTAACRRAAENLLSWAKEHGQQHALLSGGELMGTTLTAVWLEGNRLQVANLGDSRLFLLGDGDLEQLTVDGDLGASLLAAGAPPEHVAELGVTAHALRDCVGGCDRTPDGKLIVAEQHNQPTFGRWSLLPGDMLVLCSDGLVEEGLYLEPGTMQRLLRDNADRPAQEIALLLADAADALQRLPSVAEPEGMGDNVSCIVIKVVSGEW